MKNQTRLLILLFIIFVIAGCKKNDYGFQTIKKVLYIDSNNSEDEWSQEVLSSAKSILKKQKNVEIKTFFMDSKRNITESYKIKAANRGKNTIEEWKPDIVIIADDNALKYLVAPNYKESQIPFVFCGIDWDASMYGFPNSNITGMVESINFEKPIKDIHPFAKGNRISLIAPNTKSSHQLLANIKKVEIDSSLIMIVDNVKEWESSFIHLQKRSDILLMLPMQEDTNWDETKMKKITDKNSEIPSISFHKSMSKFSLLSYTNVPKEQGEWVAKRALEILAGKSPSDIPIATNNKNKIYFNKTLAQKIEINLSKNYIAGTIIIE